ncbi:MAG: DUF2812 domain-containing protein [Oscillospiraceae bacterium]|nr:DUF2812 domain-containing protein [Oscillospiraceae bacterium]
MKRIYRFHPGAYEIGENEKFYSDMEAKGWRLMKRGSYFSRFERVEPSRARYRIEVYAPPFLEQPVLPDEQVAVFEDCGWEYVADAGYLHIFRAPEGSGAPEFYVDPAQQAETLKKVRRDQWLGVLFAVLLIGAVLAFSAVYGNTGKTFAQNFKRFIQLPSTYIWYSLWVLSFFYHLVWDTWKINRTYRRLKKGIPLDHEAGGLRLLHNPALPQVFWFLSVVCLLVTGMQIAATKSDDLPPEPAGPYIMLSDIGCEGEPGKLFYADPSLTHTRSMLSDYWETVEVITLPNGTQVWMRQYVYRLRFPNMVDKLAWALMEDSTFARSAESFREIDVPGLDNAWATNGMELVAVKGGMAAYVIFLGGYDGFDPLPICEALAASWAEQ